MRDGNSARLRWLVLGTALLACQALGQTKPQGGALYKCLDAKGKVTYTGQECRNLGLKDAGPVRDALQTSPGQPVAAPASKGPGSSAPVPPGGAPPVPEEAKGPGAAAAPADPERRCFTVKTAKGTSTRCNDKPE